MFLVVALLIGISGVTYAMRRLGPFMLAAAVAALLGTPFVWLWSAIAGLISFRDAVEATLKFVAGFDVINSQVCGEAFTGSAVTKAFTALLLIAVFVLGAYSMLLPFAAVWAAIGAPILVSAMMKGRELDFTYNRDLRLARRGIYFLCSTYIALLGAGVLVRIANHLEPMIWTAHC